MSRTKEKQNIQFGEGKNMGKYNVGAKACAERIKKTKEKSILHWNKEGALIERPHPTKLPRKLVKGQGLRNFLLLKSNKVNVLQM